MTSPDVLRARQAAATLYCALDLLVRAGDLGDQERVAIANCRAATLDISGALHRDAEGIGRIATARQRVESVPVDAVTIDTPTGSLETDCQVLWARRAAGPLCRALSQLAHAPGLSDEEHWAIVDYHADAFEVLATLCDAANVTRAFATAAARLRIEGVPVDMMSMDTAMDLIQGACDVLSPATDRRSWEGRHDHPSEPGEG